MLPYVCTSYHGALFIAPWSYEVLLYWGSTAALKTYHVWLVPPKQFISLINLEFHYTNHAFNCQLTLLQVAVVSGIFYQLSTYCMNFDSKRHHTKRKYCGEASRSHNHVRKIGHCLVSKSRCEWRFSDMLVNLRKPGLLCT